MPSSPMFVCRLIAVVKTRVSPSMLPPIIIAIPSSAKARLKLETSARETPPHASRTTARLLSYSLAPRVLVRSLSPMSFASTALATKLMMSGRNEHALTYRDAGDRVEKLHVARWDRCVRRVTRARAQE